MRKNRARKGRELELQGPDSQLQSASSSPAWQADMHSKGYNGQPCASGVCILNLEGKKGEAGEELIKAAILWADLQQSNNWKSGYQWWIQPKYGRGTAAWQQLAPTVAAPPAQDPGVSPSLPLSTHFSVAPLALPERTQSSFLVLAREAKPVGNMW